MNTREPPSSHLRRSASGVRLPAVGFRGLEEGKAPRLIAADFGHAHTFGRAYYVATRFFDRPVAVEKATTGGPGEAA